MYSFRISEGICSLINSLAAAAFFILFFRPNDLFSVSFQLSFAAVLSIMLFYSYFRRLLPIQGTKWYFNILVDIRDIIAVSLSVQMITLHITLYYFHQTCNYFLLTNLAVIPLATLITLFAFATLTIGWIPGVGEILAYPLHWLTWCLNHYTLFIESLPGAYSVLP